MALTELSKSVNESWMKYAKIIEKDYSLKPSSAPKITHIADIKTLFSIKNTSAEVTLLLSERILQNQPGFFDGIIAKACFSTLFSKDAVCPECIEDLSFEFARQHLPKTIKNDWLAFWDQFAPLRELSKVLVHQPTRSYPFLYKMIGKRGLIEITREIVKMDAHDIQLKLADYLVFFEKKANSFFVTPDKTELRIINHHIANPDSENKALAKQIGITAEYLSKKKQELKERLVLREFYHASFSRIGIRMFHVLLDSGPNEEDPFWLVKDCPFLFSYRRVLSGDWSAFATFCVPDNSRSIHSLSTFQDSSDRWRYNIEMMEIVSSGSVTCLEYYNPSRREWDIPWNLLDIELKKIIEHKWASSFPKIDTPYSRTKIPLDELDLKILDASRLGITAIGDIRELLQVGQERIANKRKKLVEEKLLIHTYEVHNVGLVEHVFVSCDNQDIALALTGWIQRLPRSIAAFGINNRLFLQIRLPKGGSHAFARLLGDYRQHARLGLLDEKHQGDWGFPIHLWDEEKQDWNCPSDHIETWLERIG
ncbi:MAG: hypothetical protein GF411_18165 [Candidatus Lokiarchaeota archaeon]|nr:hypothetical protein [Candidatus Lokiarchaeota archaeon]